MMRGAVRRSCLKKASASASDATWSTLSTSASSRPRRAVRFSKRLEYFVDDSDTADGDMTDGGTTDIDIADLNSVVMDTGDDFVVPVKFEVPVNPVDDHGDDLVLDVGHRHTDQQSSMDTGGDDQGDDISEIGKKTYVMTKTESGDVVLKSATRFKKAWYDRLSHDDDYEDIIDPDDDKGDVMNLGDTLTINDPMAAATFRKLAAHLGGLSIDVGTYQSIFGHMTGTAPLGENIWHGMAAIFQSNSLSTSPGISGYPFMSKIWAEVPWVGYFVSPELFSKSTSASPVSASAPSRSWATENVYPAIFVLTGAQHRYIEDAVLGARPSSSPSNIDFYEHLEVNGKSRKTDGDAWSMAGKTVIEFDARTFEGVYMVCLKILIGGCRPWIVHASRMRLFKPLSRL